MPPSDEMAPGVSDQTFASGSHLTMIHVSYLKHLFNRRSDGARILHQSRVTEWKSYDDWSAFVTDFITTATYPAPPSNKYETYGWTPTLFEPTPIDFFDEAAGYEVVRHGDNAASHLSLFIADLDNHIEDRDRVTFEEVSRFLSTHGLSHLLYTSFSHTADKHKVRIVIPTDRDLTPEEAFGVFTVMNAALNFQLDGSIYDPGDHLYGPSVISRVHLHDDKPLAVDAWLGLVDQLPAEAREFVVRAPKTERRQPTAAEIELTRAASRSNALTDGVSIHNPQCFNPAWFDDLSQLYVGGSRHQTVMGLLIRAWLKSQMTLTRADLETLQEELDAELGGYLRRTYGSTALAKDITSVMRTVSTNPQYDRPDRNSKQQQLAKEIARLNKRRA